MANKFYAAGLGLFVAMIGLISFMYFGSSNSKELPSNSCVIKISKETLSNVLALGKIMNQNPGYKTAKDILYVDGLAKKQGYSFRNKNVIQVGNFLLKSIYSQSGPEIKYAINNGVITTSQVRIMAYDVALERIFVQEKIYKNPHQSLQSQVMAYIKQNESKCPIRIS